MSFHDIELPQKFIGFGSSMGPQHDTLIQESRGGFEHRVSNWRSPRRSYDVSVSGKTWDEIRELREFALAREGSLHSFKLKDPLDFTTADDGISAHAADDVRIATGDGATTVFYLCKQYDPGNHHEVVRQVFLVDEIAVALDATTQTETTHYTVNKTAGTITFVTAPAAGVGIFAGFSFFTEVRFQVDLDDFMKASLEDFEIGAVSAPMIEEKKSGGQALDRTNYDLGSANLQASGVTALEFQNGHFTLIAPTSALDLRLPDMRGLSGLRGYNIDSEPMEGGPYFTVLNIGTATATLKELTASGWATIGGCATTIPAGRARKLWHGTHGWRMF